MVAARLVHAFMLAAVRFTLDAFVYIWKRISAGMIKNKMSHFLKLIIDLSSLPINASRFSMEILFEPYFSAEKKKIKKRIEY